jgi:hypothetical protein
MSARGVRDQRGGRGEVTRAFRKIHIRLTLNARVAPPEEVARTGTRVGRVHPDVVGRATGADITGT